MLLVNWCSICRNVGSWADDGDMLSMDKEGNHGSQTWTDPVQVLIGPITRSQAKRYKEGLNGLIREAWNDNGASSKAFELESKHVNVIQVVSPSHEGENKEGSNLGPRRCRTMMTTKVGAVGFRATTRSSEGPLDRLHCCAIEKLKPDAVALFCK